MYEWRNCSTRMMIMGSHIQFTSRLMQQLHFCQMRWTIIANGFSRLSCSPSSIHPHLRRTGPSAALSQDRKSAVAAWWGTITDSRRRRFPFPRRTVWVMCAKSVFFSEQMGGTGHRNFLHFKIINRCLHPFIREQCIFVGCCCSSSSLSPLIRLISMRLQLCIVHPFFL